MPPNWVRLASEPSGAVQATAWGYGSALGGLTRDATIVLPNSDSFAVKLADAPLSKRTPRNPAILGGHRLLYNPKFLA